MPETVAIIGAGPLGRWLALAAARAGFRVLLEDVMPANLHHAREWLRGELGAGARPESSLNSVSDGEAGPSEQDQKQTQVLRLPVATLGVAQDDKPHLGTRPENHAAGAKAPAQSVDFMRGLKPPPTSGPSPFEVTFVTTIEDAVREADLAIDCVPDELESKLEILWLLDRMAPPRTVLATPTTRLSIADLASCTYRPEKCIAIVAEAGELTGNAGADGREILLRSTARTSAETVALVERFWRELGFMPVLENEAA